MWEELHNNFVLPGDGYGGSLPLLLDYTTQSAGRKRFQFERFWLKLDGFSEVVQFA
jgi:hypothetical protein